MDIDILLIENQINYLPNLGSEIPNPQSSTRVPLEMNPKPQKPPMYVGPPKFWTMIFCKTNLPEFLGWHPMKKKCWFKWRHGIPYSVSHGLSPKENCHHLRTGVVVCLKMVLRCHWEKLKRWSDKLNRLGHFTKLPWDLEVFSQSVESWRMFGFKLVRTGCGTLKIQFRWKLNCRSKCLELPRRNLRIKYSHDRKKQNHRVLYNISGAKEMISQVDPEMLPLQVPNHPDLE